MSDEVSETTETEETTEEVSTGFTQEKIKYFRVRDSEGLEVAYCIPESEYEENFSNLEVIEESPVLILSKAE